MDICHYIPVAQSCRNYPVLAVGAKRVLVLMFSKAALGFGHSLCDSDTVTRGLLNLCLEISGFEAMWDSPMVWRGGLRVWRTVRSLVMQESEGGAGHTKEKPKTSCCTICLFLCFQHPPPGSKRLSKLMFIIGLCQLVRPAGLAPPTSTGCKPSPRPIDRTLENMSLLRNPFSEPLQNLKS